MDINVHYVPGLHMDRGWAGPGTLHWAQEFPNGYGVSIINCGYGRDLGKYELALTVDGRPTNAECWAETDSVIGWLTWPQCMGYLVMASELPTRLVVDND